MPSHMFAAGEAARALGISIETLRRWDRSGRIAVQRDHANRRMVPASEIERLRAARGTGGLSARNTFPGIVRSVRIEGLLAEIEIEVTDPVRVVATITARSAHELDLRPGSRATGVVKATSVMVQGE